MQSSETQRGFRRSTQERIVNFRRGGEKRKNIMGGWWFELVILGIFFRTQTHSENNKIAKKLQ